MVNPISVEVIAPVLTGGSAIVKSFSTRQWWASRCIEKNRMSISDLKEDFERLSVWLIAEGMPSASSSLLPVL
jgi:hypothetical protein